MTQLGEFALRALAGYRAYIEDANRHAMLAIIPEIEAAGSEDFGTPEEIQAERLRFVRAMLGAGPELPIQRPADVLRNWDALVTPLVLDGAAVNPDPEWRAAMRKVYKSAILQGLGRLECPDGQWALPVDFEAVMNEVDSLEGPGWWASRNLGSHIFWEGWGENFGRMETPRRIQERVKDGQAIIQLVNQLDHNYDVAGGWELGCGVDAVFLAVYSRPKAGERQVWSWRYVASLGRVGIKIFKDLGGVLDWYKKYR
ncbi:hypothetical protein B0I35DRAFT_443421 [Stachybotrys elegans]|uniref:Uncharacterized protein n=1 Tax=Stachybotrys elegans TaxID=80388 RepID=A0A8K0SGK3_9HYPO|nr:hypothetical protein B0I35DRAFT_443421 [Stachybotrys elegans]